MYCVATFSIIANDDSYKSGNESIAIIVSTIFMKFIEKFFSSFNEIH